MRKSYGPFKSVDDLRAIKGIGPKGMEKMRKFVTVGKVLAPKHPQNAPANNARAAPSERPSP